jgi:hypothetical protein
VTLIPHRDDPPRAHDAPAPLEPAPPASAPRALAPPQALGVPAILALQRTAGNRAVTALLRSLAGPPQQQKTDVGDATLSFEWSVRWAPKGGTVIVVAGDPGKRELTMPVQAGTEGKLTIDVQTQVDAGDPATHLPGRWKLRSRCEWRGTLERNGRLTVGVPAPSHHGDKGSMVQQSGPPDVSASPDVAEFKLTQGYAGETESTEWSVGGFGYDEGKGTARPANTGSESFVVALDIQGIEGPQVEIGKVQVFQRQTHDVQFSTERNTRISGKERAELLAWYAGLSKLTRRRLKAGKQPMRLETYASSTGPADTNHLKYAQGRLGAVHDVLDRFVTKWDPPPRGTPFGEDKTPDAPNLEPAEERRGHEHPDPSRLIARLIVEDERTPGADADDDFDLLPTD